MRVGRTMGRTFQKNEKTILLCSTPAKQGTTADAKLQLVPGIASKNAQRPGHYQRIATGFV